MTTREKVIDILNGIKPMDWENCENLIEDGGLDSMSLFMLINMIGMNFGFAVSVADLDPEVFTSVDTLTEMIEKHING